MKRIIILPLLCLFLSGCGIDYNSEITQLWSKIEMGSKYTFTLNHRRTQEERYYRIERISEKEFNSLRTKDVE